MGTEPPWAVLLGVVVAGESLGWLGAFGCVLIVGASYAGQRIKAGVRASTTVVDPGTAGIHNN